MRSAASAGPSVSCLDTRASCTSTPVHGPAKAGHEVHVANIRNISACLIPLIPASFIEFTKWKMGVAPVQPGGDGRPPFLQLSIRRLFRHLQDLVGLYVSQDLHRPARPS